MNLTAYFISLIHSIDISLMQVGYTYKSNLLS